MVNFAFNLGSSSYFFEIFKTKIVTVMYFVEPIVAMFIRYSLLEYVCLFIFH